MARYKIILNVEGSRIDSVRQRCLSVFGSDISAQVTKIEQQTRADRLSDAAGLVQDAVGILEELRGELDEWKSNLPENLQDGGKAEELDEAMAGLDEIKDVLENVDFGNVSFPRMM